MGVFPFFLRVPLVVLVFPLFKGKKDTAIPGSPIFKTHPNMDIYYS